jgi:hypothetical protein
MKKTAGARKKSCTSARGSDEIKRVREGEEVSCREGVGGAGGRRGKNGNSGYFVA